ncbi:hypothetical protein [Streptomyces sp. NPDC058861]|uniref:hypothetical protein n=1 Tax=Streptomyces sp. NPDC058861 TaxID=3346653 RepID=UPI0036B09CEB
MTRPAADAARRRPALPPAKPVVLFSDEASAVAQTAQIPEWARATRSPLEHLTWRQPPVLTDEEGVV